MKSLITKIVIAVVVVGLVVGVGYHYWKRSADPAITFRTVPVKRGDLLATISATGTIEPEEVVDVGTRSTASC